MGKSSNVLLLMVEFFTLLSAILLVSIQTGKASLRYELDELPPRSELFLVASEGSWQRLEQGSRRWVGTGAPPSSYYTMACSQECLSLFSISTEELPAATGGIFVVGLPGGVKEAVERVFTEACSMHDLCKGVVLIKQMDVEFKAT